MAERTLFCWAWSLLFLLNSHGCFAITAEMQGVLDQHNVYRCMHGVPALEWDDAIAANAQAWADNGQYEHSANSQRKINGEQCGENLAWGYPSYGGISSTDAWYSEIQFTDPFGTADGPEDSTNPSEAIGHYTQLVWKSSTKLGCGKGKATVQGKEGDYWVCQYCTAGNYLGEFTENVLAPTKKATDCGGSSSDEISPSGSSAGGSSSGEAYADLPSSCSPEAKLAVGSLCAYGYQCQSSFCCPRLKVCLKDSSTSVSSTDIKNKVKSGEADKIVSIIFTDGGTCKDPWSNGNNCMQTGEGKPLAQWDQSKCGCKEEYMTMYKAGTWIYMNEGVSCGSGDSSGGGGGGQMAVADFAGGPSGKVPILFALLILLTWSGTF